MKTSDHRSTLTVGSVTVTVVDRTELEAFPYESGFLVMARREPYEVILEERKGAEVSRRRVRLEWAQIRPCTEL